MHNKKIVLITLFTLSVLLLTGCAKQVAQVNVNQDTKNENVNVDTVVSDEIDTSDWLTYTNEEYGFSFKYPKEWSVNSSNSYEYVPGILFSKDLHIENRNKENVDIHFSLTSLSLDEMISSIETSDILSDGSSLANVGEIREESHGEKIMYKSSHQTALGIPINFSYISIDSTLALYIYYYEFEDTRTNIYEMIINTLHI